MADRNKGGTPAQASPADTGVDEEMDMIAGAANNLGLDTVQFEREERKERAEEEESEETEATEETEEEAEEPEDSEEAEETEETEDETDSDEEPETDPDADPEDQKLRSKLSPKLQKAFDKAVGRKHRRMREAEEALEAVKQQNAALNQQLAEASGKRPAATPQGIHPLMLTSDPGEIDDREQKLRDFIDFAVEYEDEGYPGKDDGSDQPIEAKDLRKSKLAAERELRDIIPAARDKIQKAEKLVPYIRKHYPNLFDAKHPDNQLAQNLIRQQPWLRQYPHALLLVGYMIEGMKATQARDNAAGNPPPKKKKPAPKIPVPKKGGPSQPSPVSEDEKGGDKKGGVIDVEKFASSDGSRESLADVVSTLV